MAKRGNGEGSIFRDSKGRWTAAVTIGYRNGKQHRKFVRRKTRNEVVEELKKILRDQQLGLPIPHAKLTLGEFLRSWLAGAKLSVRAKTYRSYEQMVRNHFAPSMFPKTDKKKHAPKPKTFPEQAIARTQLAKVSVEDVERFLTQKLRDGCSAELVRYLRVVLRIALNQALARGIVARNVAALAKPPRCVSKEIAPLNVDQAKQLLASIKGHRREALFKVILSIGLRHGEALALQLEDYDSASGVLRVFFTLQRVDGSLQRVETKSSKGKRFVPLPDFCIAAIKKHLAARESLREWAGARWRETGYLFCSSIGTPLLERNVLRDLRKALEAAGLPKCRMHDLRHSCVTILGELGVPLRTIADIVGHSDIRLTQNVYQHAFMGMKRDAVAKMSEKLTSIDHVKRTKSTAPKTPSGQQRRISAGRVAAPVDAQKARIKVAVSGSY